MSASPGLIFSFEVDNSSPFGFEAVPELIVRLLFRFGCVCIFASSFEAAMPLNPCLSLLLLDFAILFGYYWNKKY